MVVDIGERRDAETVALRRRLQPLAGLRLAQDVAQGLRPAGIAVRLHMAVEYRGEIVVDRQGDALHAAPCPAAGRMHNLAEVHTRALLYFCGCAVAAATPAQAQSPTGA